VCAADLLVSLLTPAAVIYGSLKEPSMDKFKRVTNYSTAIAAVSAISMSVAGYWSFTDKTLGNILVRASAPLLPGTI